MMFLPKKYSHEGWMDPFQELETLQGQINRLLGFPALRSLEDGPAWLSRPWAPAIDVYNEKDHLVVKADLPGLKKDEIDVSVEEDVLTIKGEKKQEAERKEKGYIRSERFYGGFQRSIALPAQVDANKVKASFKDGVLELTLPKREDAKPKQIKVDVE